ncbi:MAG: TOBE domain-containing protein, partial [Candidatus Binatia bacterium]
VVVRPERVTVSASSPPPGTHCCTVPVTIRDVVFQGPVLRCRMRNDSGDDIIANIDEALRPEGLVAGARMWAVWDPTAARLLRPRTEHS